MLHATYTMDNEKATTKHKQKQYTVDLEVKIYYMTVPSTN
jgi:hypothetical protein